MERCFVDTSAWFAYINSRDQDHHAVKSLLAHYQGRLIHSNYIFDETVTYCLYRLGHTVATKVGETLLSNRQTDLIHLTQSDEHLAWQLFRARPDKTYSFTDCTSFVLMRRLKLTRAITLDADFRREGFDCLPAR